MSLSKVSRKLRKKMKKGRVALYGAEQTAKDVVGAWKYKRETEGEKWASEYKKGVLGADTRDMETNLGLWYSILQTKIAPRLSMAVRPIYNEVIPEYREQKRVKVPAVAK